MPNLVVMAGPNGAGKTTTARALLKDERRVDEFVNADIVALEQGLDDVAAGRYVLRRMDALVAEHKGDNSEEDNPLRVAERPVNGRMRIYNERLWAGLRRRYMKPSDTAQEPGAPATPGFTMDEIFEAACRGVSEAIARHKALGQSIVVWRDGKIVTLQPEEIEV
jgi:hypothetical protein